MRAMPILFLAMACSSSSKPDLLPPPPGSGGEGGRTRTADAAGGESGAGGTDGAVIEDAAPREGGAVPDAAADFGAPVVDMAVPMEVGPGGASRCPGSGFAVCESFEDTAIDAIPGSWIRRQGYGGMFLGVASDESMRGQRSLRILGGLSGSQFIEYRALGALASSHWGRIFFKVKTPAPWPTSGVLHGDLVEHLGPHPGGGTNGVRWGIVENPQMKFQWIYNVQPSQGEPEFGDGTAYNYSWPGTWQCLEWRYDQPSQQGMLWIDGAQIPITVGKSHPPEIPVFTGLGVGWANYQNAPGDGFTVWIDEVAFDKARIGCDR